MRLVLDTEVVVAALRSPKGASAEILRLLDRGKFTALVSVALALEYEAVCLLPEHILASGLPVADVEAFVSTLIDLTEPVLIHYHWRPALKDPGDEMVLETAVNGNAGGIVTFNQRDYQGVRHAFGVHVWSPQEALTRIRNQYQ